MHCFFVLAFNELAFIDNIKCIPVACYLYNIDYILSLQTGGTGAPPPQHTQHILETLNTEYHVKRKLRILKNSKLNLFLILCVVSKECMSTQHTEHNLMEFRIRGTIFIVFPAWQRDNKV